jgi:ppGpp synthetase/RelA/SpoT-type nucleotidyltranferase
MKRISEAIKDLNNFFSDFKNEIKDMFLDEQTVAELFDRLEKKVKNHLIILFGKEDDVSDLGVTESIIKYLPDTESNYSDAVMFSYWTFRGERSNYMPDALGEWRDNFFYKGRRWSNPMLKKQFYEVFRLIMGAVNSKAPVNYFTEIGATYQKHHFKIIAGDYDNHDGDTIVLPNTEKLIEFESENITKLITWIKQWRSNLKSIVEEGQFTHFMGLPENSVENIKQLFHKGAEDLKRLPFINDIRENLKNVFKLNGSFQIDNLDLPLMMLVFLFYDHPYDIYFYLPEFQPDDEQNINKKTPDSSLIMSVRQGTSDMDKYKEVFLQLSNTLGSFPRIERTIWNKWRNDLPTYWQWKKNYEKRQKKYERLSEVAMNVCRAVCDKHDIECSYMPHRIKKFDSFYHKMICIANVKSTKTWDIERRNKFRVAIQQGNKNAINDICNELSDIAGIRVVLPYADQVKFFKDVFHELREKNEIEFKEEDERDYSQSHETPSHPNATNFFDYRSYHLIFTLGEKRQDLYDCRELEKLRCEVQIRTILADGWANVSHELFYKPNLWWSTLPDKEKEPIESLFNSTSGSLFHIDSTFVDLKKKIEGPKVSSLEK